jgi:DNA-directed RNA polymerase subunit beta'
MLQEAADALYDNSRRTRPVMGNQKLPLKSLSDLLKGKQGRFRQNLLGKRVDYSGRSVIVIGPELKLNECGLPLTILSELFKPVLINRLVELGYATNEKVAKHMILANHPMATQALSQVIKHKYVLLNRAPTLHKLSIQAFSPKIIDDNAIRVHPLVCKAFNADFDGDQMAVHLPVTIESQAEATILMSPQYNLRSPINGKLVTILNNDMVLGIYWLTDTLKSSKRKDKSKWPLFTSFDELSYAFSVNAIGVREPILLYDKRYLDGTEEKKIIETTYGRALFNNTLEEYPQYINKQVNKQELSNVLNEISNKAESQTTMRILDALKDLGFYWAMHSETSIGIEDTRLPIDKKQLMDKYETQVQELTNSYSMGFITKDEYDDDQISIWTKATNEVMECLKEKFHLLKPFYTIVESGARGNITQMRQLVGMRGLIFNARNKTVVKPIKNNFIEGLNITEYFISTHGARKGLADTALRTADSGYLTRRLVDVCQNIIIHLDDCDTKLGLEIPIARKHPYIQYLHEDIENLFCTRYLARTVEVNGRRFERNTLIDRGILDFFIKNNVDSVSVRSPLKCEASFGICKKCYGYLLSYNQDSEIGDCVGVIAAQSIGEPGTQLTMQTFHTGGVATEDITLGLPRIIELFEARKGDVSNSIFSEIDGIVKLKQEEDNAAVRIEVSSAAKNGVAVTRRYLCKAGMETIRVNDGQHVVCGEALTYNNLNQHEILDKLGPNYAQLYILNEIQKVYHSHGVFIHCKHIDVIMRKMFSQVEIVHSGNVDYQHLSTIDRHKLLEYNNSLLRSEDKEKQLLIGKQIIVGITKCSLITDSWLSAASFQETTRILMNSAFNGSDDMLRGLKENIIIGEAIPAGTGMRANNNVKFTVLNKAYYKALEEKKKESVI